MDEFSMSVNGITFSVAPSKTAAGQAGKAMEKVTKSQFAEIIKHVAAAAAAVVYEPSPAAATPSAPAPGKSA